MEIKLLFSPLKIMWLLTMLLHGLLTQAQCDTANFTATPTDGTCFANGEIAVQVPGATNCNNWTAIITNPDSSENSIAIPANGGPVSFTGLAAGNYNVRLFNGLTTVQAPNNPIAIATSYVNMSISSSSTATSCGPTSANYVPDAQLTVTIDSGGVGPFVYSITTMAGTFSTPPIMATSYTFTDADIAIENAEIVSFTVTDQVNGQSGCEASVTQTPTIVNNPIQPMPYRATLLQRDCSDTSCDDYTSVFRTGSSAGLSAFLNQPGNATISINGGAAQQLTYLGQFNASTGEFSAPVTIPAGVPYVLTFNTGCDIITISETAPAINDDTDMGTDGITALTHTQSSGIDADNGCQPFYQVTLQSRTSGLGAGFSNAFGIAAWFCETNTVTFELETPTGSGIYVPVTTSPNDPLGFTSVTYSLPSAGHYRVTATDACHTVVDEFDILEPTNILDGINIPITQSVIEGTGAFAVQAPNITAVSLYSYPLTVEINPTPFVPSTTITPSQPGTLAGSYTINFPYTVVLNDTNTTGITLGVIGDLPGGDYEINISDDCGQNRTPQQITIDQLASYTPDIQVVSGCNNSSSIIFDSNPVNANGIASYRLYTDDGTGAPGTLVGVGGGIQNSTQGEATYNNLASGDYVVRVENHRFLTNLEANEHSVARNATGVWPLYWFSGITIDPYEDITVNVTSVLCDTSDPNSGIVSIDITDGTPVYPQTYELFTSPGGVLVQTYTAADASDPSALDHTFTGVAAGDYVVTTSNACYSVDNNITISNADPGADIFLTADTVCPGNPSTVVAVGLAPSLWDVTWYEGSIAPGNDIATGVSNVTVTPTVTTDYFVEYSLNTASSGCTTPTTYTDSATVIVTADIDPNMTVSDIDLCLANPFFVSIEVDNVPLSNNGFWAELLDENGMRLQVISLAGGTGTSNLFTLLPPYPPDGTEYSVVVYNADTDTGNPGCSLTLADTAIITDGTPDTTLAVSSNSPVCVGDDAAITITAAQDGAVYEVLEGGNPLTPPVTGTGTGADLVLIIPAAQVNTGDTTYSIAVSGTRCTDAVLDNTITITQNPDATAAAETTTCATNGQSYTVEVVVTGTAPLTAIGTGAPGTWVDNIDGTHTWTSDAIPAGTDYNITIQDTNACNSIAIADVAPNCCPQNTLAVASTIVIDADCGVDNGVATVNVAGGSGNYTYTWIPNVGTPNATGNSRTDLPSGTYTVSIWDTDWGVNPNPSCPDLGLEEIVVVGTNSNLNASIVSTTPATCGNADGSAELSPDTYTYSWSDGGTGAIRNDLAAGCYTITVSDASGLCDDNIEVCIVRDENSLQVTPTIISRPDCGNSDGEVNLSIIGGTAPYTATWSDGGSGISRTDLTAGVLYTIEVTDASGCTGSTEVIFGNDNITGSNSLTLLNASDPLCTGENSGNASFDFNCAGCNQPTQLLLIAPDGSTTDITTGGASNLSAGVYGVTYIDGNGCILNALSFELIDPPVLNININKYDAECITNPNGLLQAEVTGGTPGAGYVFIWSTGDVDVNTAGESEITPGAGTYSLLVTDSVNCQINITDLEITEIIDTDPPVFVEALPGDLTVECDAVPVAEVLTATDNCGTATVTFTEVRTDGACPNSYILTRTWIATDTSGLTTVHTQTITVEDTTAPAFVETLPADVTVECDAVPTAETLTATDNCGTATVTFAEVRTDGTCANDYSLARTWTATDECGLTTIHTQTITVEDTTAPAFVEALPADVTVECDAVPTAETLTATDNCGTATVTFAEVRTDGTCANDYSLARTWTATDECGLTTVHTQTITVEDTTAPAFVEALPADVTVECDAVPTAETLTATDNCGDATVTFAEVRTDGTCANDYSLARTWTATDECGLTTVHTQTITVQDTTAPAFVEALPADITVECDAVPVAETLTATDNCGTATVTFAEVRTDGTCANDYSLARTWTATDECGLTTVHTQTITVEDTKAPAFVEALPADVTVECDAVPTAETLTATDNCGTATVTFAEVRTDGTCANEYSLARTWTATDECGLTTIHTQTITVQDTTAPAFVEALPADVTVECDAVPTAEVLTATDNCGTAVVTFAEVRIDGSCANNYSLERTWTATDECGLTTVHTQMITVQDTTAPAFVEALPADVTVECDAVPTAETLTATDNCGTATVTFAEVRTDGTCANEYSLARTWTATDECGLTTVHTQTITVQDTTAPAFVEALPADVTVECDAVPVAEVLTATDNCGTATVTFVEIRIDGSCVNNYSLERTWTATDECGLTTVHTQTITVEDTTAPTIDTEAQDLTVECDGSGNIAEYQAWLNNNGGAIANDACGEVIWTTEIVAVSQDCGETGTTIVNFTPVDECGNVGATTQATFIIQDTVGPDITISSQDLTVECDSNGNTNDLIGWLNSNGGAVANDDCSGVVWTNDYTALSDGCGVTGSATVTFTATDDCGNTNTTTATFTIVDTVSPTIITDASNVRVECDGEGNVKQLQEWLNSNAGATAEDSCSGVTWTNDFTSLSDDCGATGSATVTFTATDACGNATTATASFTIEDTTAPEFTEALPEDFILECDQEVPAAEVLTASDSCSDATVTFNEVTIAGACAGSYILERTWTATDDCGNDTSFVQTITVQDTTPPVFVETLPENTFASCDDIPEATVITAIDNCGDVTVSYTETEIPGECSNKYAIERIWIATDDCGNTATHTQVIKLACEIETYNAISLNGDGMNDVMVFKGIDCYPNNTVKIFNRWGVLVFETDAYDNETNAFRGYSDGRITIAKDEKLPTGTYFYILEYEYSGDGFAPRIVEQSGYLYVSSDN